MPATSSILWTTSAGGLLLPLRHFKTVYKMRHFLAYLGLKCWAVPLYTVGLHTPTLASAAESTLKQAMRSGSRTPNCVNVIHNSPCWRITAGVTSVKLSPGIPVTSSAQPPPRLSWRICQDTMSLLQQYVLSLPRDLTIRCGAISIHVHRLLMCAHFEFFSGFAASGLTQDSSQSEMHDLPGGKQSLLAIEELLYGSKPGATSTVPDTPESCLLLAAAVHYLQPRDAPPPPSGAGGPSPLVLLVLTRLQRALEYQPPAWSLSPQVLGKCVEAVRSAAALPGGMAGLPPLVADMLRHLLADMLQHTHDIPPQYKGDGALSWCPENLVLELLRGAMGPSAASRTAMHEGAELTEGPCTRLDHPMSKAPLSVMQHAALHRASSADGGGGGGIAPRWFHLVQGSVQKLLKVCSPAQVLLPDEDMQGGVQAPQQGGGGGPPRGPPPPPPGGGGSPPRTPPRRPHEYCCHGRNHDNAHFHGCD